MTRIGTRDNVGWEPPRDGGIYVFGSSAILVSLVGILGRTEY